MKNNEQSLRNMWGIMKGTNLSLMGISEGERERKRQKEFLNK